VFGHGYFGDGYFAPGYFGSGASGEDAGPAPGGKGDNEARRRKILRVPFKPTGLGYRGYRKGEEPPGRKSVDERVEQSRNIGVEIARDLASGFRAENELIAQRELTAQRDAEIGRLLKLRTEENDLMLILLMASAT